MWFSFVRCSFVKERAANRGDHVWLASAIIAITFLAAAPVSPPLYAEETTTTKSEPHWIRPGFDGETRPIWGHAAGIRIGLSPLPGPRGLLRVYTPYLHHPDQRPINYIAVEPIPHGEQNRGLSELEFSRLDKLPGKRFQPVDDPRDTGNAPNRLASGVVRRLNGVECLQLFILIEPFDNRAHVYLRLTFRADLPHEVGIATFAHDDSRPLDYCIVTATMGNYARLRQLKLATQTVTAQELWPDYRGFEFAPHARFELNQLTRLSNGSVLVTARSNESEPARANYAFGTRRNWRYVGDAAEQSWRVDAPDANLACQVNGRRVYWGSISEIPGGIAFENFELVTPFHSGNEFWFSVEPVRQGDSGNAASAPNQEGKEIPKTRRAPER